MVFNKIFLKEIITLSIIVALLHNISLVLYLYWRTSWFDILMHLLGGLLVALICGFVYYTSGYLKLPKTDPFTIFLMLLGSVLIVGLFWELWELFFGFSDALSDRVDTMIDLVMDIMGGTVGYYYMIGKIWQK